MRKIDIETLRNLADNKDLTCLSFYLPMARFGKDSTANPTRLKNQLAEARARLSEMGMEQKMTEHLLEPIEEVVPKYEFWQHQDDGLAILRSENVLKMFSVPPPVPELVMVSNRFHLKPLLPQLDGHQHFHILAVSEGHVRLYQADRWNIEDVSPKDMPKTREDFAPLDNPQRTLQENQGIAGATHGLDRDYQHRLIEDFYHAVDREVTKYLNKHGGSLILAGPKAEVHRYRHISKWSDIVEEVIEGAMDRKAAKEIHEAAYEIFQANQQQEIEAQKARVIEAIGRNGHGCSDFRKAVAAAAFGQIDTVFIPLDEHQWGNFDPDTGEVNHAERDRHCSNDLLDFIAMQTILHGGRVFPVKREQMPGGETVAALLRY